MAVRVRKPGTVDNLLIGCDPELFVFDTAIEKFVSAHNLLPGDKLMPAPLMAGACQVDGVAAEFNIEPAADSDQFCAAIRTVTDQILDILHQSKDTLTLVAQPTAEFGDDIWTLPDHVTELGCTPDYNAWRGGQENAKPSNAVTYRTGGGHIHIGYTENKSESDIPHFHDCIELTKQLDAALFIPSLLYDRDTQRRTLYGKMGAFRPKSFGVEYRPLSNVWVSDPDLCRWVYHNAAEAFHMLEFEEYKLCKDNELNNIISLYDVSSGEMPEELQVREYCVALHELGFERLPDRYWE